MIPKKKIVFGLTSIILLMMATSLIYLSTGTYSANEDAVSALASAENYTVTEYDNGTMAFLPAQPKAGLIFYPGGKVDSESYAPLMAEFAQKNVLCVLLNLPFDLAIFDGNAADGIQEQYPDIDQWYLAGHSLGGAMAASYAAVHPEEYKGLFLLAAYSIADLTESELEVVSLYGSEDCVLNMEKYAEHYSNLPKSTHEYVIEGGCHAYFGSYGFQNGDGTPTITNVEQIQITVAQCMTVMK